jgi:hypothetical protein
LGDAVPFFEKNGVFSGVEEFKDGCALESGVEESCALYEDVKSGPTGFSLDEAFEFWWQFDSFDGVSKKAFAGFYAHLFLVVFLEFSVWEYSGVFCSKGHVVTVRFDKFWIVGRDDSIFAAVMDLPVYEVSVGVASSMGGSSDCSSDADCEDG